MEIKTTYVIHDWMDNHKFKHMAWDSFEDASNFLISQFSDDKDLEEFQIKKQETMSYSEEETEKNRSFYKSILKDRFYSKVTKKQLMDMAYNWADLLSCDTDMSVIDKLNEELEIVKEYQKNGYTSI